MLRALFSLALVGCGLAQFTTDSEWIKFSKMKCEYNLSERPDMDTGTTNLGTESSLAAAKISCQSQGDDGGLSSRCNVIMDPKCDGSKGFIKLDNCAKASRSRANTCIYMRKGAWAGGAGSNIIGNGRHDMAPTCSYRNTCTWDEENQNNCALRLCEAAGFDGGRYIFSSGNPCSDSFTKGVGGAGFGWNYKMDEDKIVYTSPNTDAAVVAECYEFAPCQNLNKGQCRKIKINGEAVCEWSRESGACDTPRGSCAGIEMNTKEEHRERCPKFKMRKPCKSSGCKWVTYEKETEALPRGCHARKDAEETSDTGVRMVTRCKRMDNTTCCKAKGCNWNGSISRCLGSFKGWKDS